MSIYRRAAKRDSVEPEIVEALVKAGCTVERLSKKGVPDLLVGFIDPDTNVPTNILMEAKSKGGKLTQDQIDWIAKWQGQVYVVYSIEEALQAVGR